MGTPSTDDRRPPRPTAGALIGTVLGIEIAFLARNVSGGAPDGEAGVFWFVVSLLLLLGIRRRSRVCWVAYVVLEIAAAATVLVAAPDLQALALVAAPLVTIAALVSPQVRAHVRERRPTDATWRQVELQDV